MLRSTGARAATAVAPIAAALLTAASASADLPDPQPVQLSPVNPPTNTHPGGVTPLATRGVAYTCNNAGTLRRRANSYVMGWCMAGQRIDIDSTVITQGWQGGYSYGNYANCGWVNLAGGLTQSGTWQNDCGNATFSESYFANKINNNSTDDGYPVAVKKNCYAYANVRPWRSDITGSWDQVPGNLDTTTDQFYWRYRSKDDNWVLGRWTRNGVNQPYAWVFVQKDCVDTPPDGALKDPSTDIPAP